MIRTTTPTHIFKFAEPLTFSVLQITYKQDGDNVLVKTDEDVTVDGNCITLKLSQADTKAFKPGVCYVQIKAIDAAGVVTATLPVQIKIFDVLNEELMA